MNKKHFHNPRSQERLKFSKAPYNFVSLEKEVVEAPEPLPHFDRYHEDRYTGYIDLEIKALTPIYIRDTLNDEEFNKKLEHEKKAKETGDKTPFQHPPFFSPGNLYRIPGSSLRGMIRTLVEIVSWGKFEFFENSRLYFRFLADKKKELRDYYRSRLQKPKAGLLKKKGFKSYVIIPTEYEAKEDISRAEEIIQKEGGWMLYSGAMKGKRRNYFIKKPKDDTTEIPVDYNKVIRSYIEDKNRNSNINLIKCLEEREKFNDGIPCFYSCNEREEITAIGHTPTFRIPYKNTIGDCIRQQKIKGYDLVEAIFGNQTTHASRVFFEAAYAEGEVKLCEETYPRILSGPKPTCIQHYLDQNNKNNNLNHYDSYKATIRGYKLYWHRDANDWKETDEENIKTHASQYTKIQPVREGTIFKGRIRFENLTNVELGALLFVLYLPDGLAHKIGMAKPLGLGSIKITPTLYLSDRKRRYTELFAEWKDLPEACGHPRIKEFIKNFEDFMLQKIPEGKNIQSLWDTDRLKALKIMLDWTKKPSNEKTEYLSLKEFRDRPILPPPAEIIKKP